MIQESVKRLTMELWDIIVSDNGDQVKKLKQMKKKEDRRGKVKRLICNAIDDSSLGCFNGLMYYFGGKTYDVISRSELSKTLFNIVSNKMEMPDGDLVKLSDLYLDCVNAVLAKPLEVSNSIMIFRNGVLDVDAGKFYRRFDKRFVQMWAVDYDYNPDARTFLWHQFINQVLPDQYLQDVLQMFLGATFINRDKVKIEHILILLGRGANGKSVIQKTVCGVLGDEYVTTQEVGRLCARGMEGDMAVAEINGKRLNYCTEMETTDFYKKSARLKAIVSGEKVPARRLYGTPFYAQNIPLLMANANAIPIFNKQDDALLRRIYVIPFNVSIPPERQNKTLNDELVEEYPAILNWILDGRDKFIKNGYILPRDLNFERIIITEKTSLNTALKFMDVNRFKARLEGVELEPLNWMKLIDLYRKYERWCEANELEPIKKTTFSYCLENEGGFRKERRANGVCFAVYGDKTISKLKKEQRLQRMKEKRPGAITMVVDGRLYASSLKSLAAYANVGLSTVLRLNREGKFKNYTLAFREKAVYDIEGCCDIMRELMIIATDEQKDIDKRIRKELKYLRFTFNQRMEYNGWPFRKYAREEPQIDSWCEVVPDEMTDDEVYKIAIERGLDTSKWNRFNNITGVHSRGGKGFHDSMDDIPTDNEIKEIEKIKNN